MEQGIPPEIRLILGVKLFTCPPCKRGTTFDLLMCVVSKKAHEQNKGGVAQGKGFHLAATKNAVSLSSRGISFHAIHPTSQVLLRRESG